MEYVNYAVRAKLEETLARWQIRVLQSKCFFFSAAGAALLIWAFTN